MRLSLAILAVSVAICDTVIVEMSMTLTLTVGNVATQTLLSYHILLRSVFAYCVFKIFERGNILSFQATSLV